MTDEHRREEAIRRLQAVVDVAGYWTPLGKLAETLIYVVPETPSKHQHQADMVVDLLLGDDR